MNAILLQLVKWFVERQLIKWGQALDWALVKADLVARVKDLLPGDQFDDVAAYTVGVLIDLIAAAFKGQPSVVGLPQAMDHAVHALPRELAVRALKAG